jgi:hypothetical protein
LKVVKAFLFRGVIFLSPSFITAKVASGKWCTPAIRNLLPAIVFPDPLAVVAVAEEGVPQKLLLWKW